MHKLARRGQEGQLHCTLRGPGEAAAQDGQKMWISILSSGREECSRKRLKRNLEISHTRRDTSTRPWPAAMDKGKQTHRLCSQACSKARSTGA